LNFLFYKEDPTGSYVSFSASKPAESAKVGLGSGWSLEGFRVTDIKKKNNNNKKKKYILAF
jgi:hypothetical protein